MFRTKIFSIVFVIVAILLLISVNYVQVFAEEANQPSPAPPLGATLSLPTQEWVREGDSFCHNYLGGVVNRDLKNAKIFYGNLGQISTKGPATVCFTPFSPPSGSGGPPAWAWAIWQ